MKAALYIRVSTDEQAKEGFSLPAQINELENYCKRQKIKIHKTYIDEGVSARYSETKKRPQFELMLKDAKNKLFDIIVVHKYDRFARNVELSKRVKRQLKESGIAVISMSEPIEDSPIGFFQEGILELLAEYYIRNLSEEVKKGQKEKVSQGFAVNMLCYGYKNTNGNVSVVQNEADTVRLIYDMYLKNTGITTIAKWLNKNGIPTKKHGNWYSSQIRYILKNKTYTGCLKWGEKCYDNVIPKIIDEAVFEKAQNKMLSVPNIKKRSYFDEFLLLGIAKCGYCGSPYRISKMYANGNKNNKLYFMYTCSKARIDKGLCSFSKHFQSADLEDTVNYNLKDIMKGHTLNFNIDKSDKQIILEKRKLEIEKELKRAKEAYLHEVFTLDEYSDTKLNLETELKNINININNFLSEFGIKNLITEKHMSLYEKYKKAKSIPVKKDIMQDFIKVIEIYEDSIRITFQA